LQDVTAEAKTIESTPAGAVETIQALALRIATADGRSLHLRFSIGGSDLWVRVGHLGDAVRTTFVTESPELRAALLQEWQALTSSGADRAGIRFADPVFSVLGQGGEANAAFDAASQHDREPAARREPFPAPVGFFRPRVSGSSTTPAGSLPVGGSPPRGSTQHLHTFA
jgi:hypothetical protein